MNYTDYTYDTEYDLRIRLRMPEGVENPPVFIYIHGGGIENGSYTGTAYAMEELCRDGIATAAIGYRLYTLQPNPDRHYPSPKFPEFIEDCAKAVDYVMNKMEQKFSGVYIGGSSAGAYLSMMLFFDAQYLGKYNIDPLKLNGYVFDAGQPTVHFNVLRERGMDTRLVRLDEAAPLYHITKDYTGDNLPKIVNITSSNDITCRPEQLKLLHATMQHFKYPAEKMRFYYMNGYSHCAYNGQRVFVDMIESIIK